MGDLVAELAEAVIESPLKPQEKLTYRIGEDIFAKYTILPHCEKEFEIGNYLRANGVNVPEMYDFVGTNELRDRLGINAGPAHMGFLLMERISGYNREYIFGAERKEIEPKFLAEIEKVLRLGFLPKDSFNKRNSIVHEQTGEVYLIDFELWEYPVSEETIKNFRKEYHLPEMLAG